MSPLSIFAALILSATQTAEPPPKTAQVAVMPLVAKRIPTDTTEVLDDILLGAVHRQSAHKVIGASDINAMLGLERMKDALGCNDTVCAAEIGGALGVDYLLAGAVSRLGENVFITLKLVDIRNTEVMGRGQVKVQNDENLFSNAMTRAVQEVLHNGTPSAISTRNIPQPTKQVIELDGPMYERFVSAGLDRPAYVDFASSQLSYSVWARKYNQSTESWLLEISKWMTAGSMLLVAGVMAATQHRHDRWEHMVLPILPIGITTGGLFVLDAVNIGNAPDSMKDF